jgi:hypothetical protein
MGKGGSASLTASEGSEWLRANILEIHGNYQKNAINH